MEQNARPQFQLKPCVLCLWLAYVAGSKVAAILIQNIQSINDSRPQRLLSI